MDHYTQMGNPKATFGGSGRSYFRFILRSPARYNVNVDVKVVEGRVRWLSIFLWFARAGLLHPGGPVSCRNLKMTGAATTYFALERTLISLALNTDRLLPPINIGLTLRLDYPMRCVTLVSAHPSPAKRVQIRSYFPSIRMIELGRQAKLQP